MQGSKGLPSLCLGSWTLWAMIFFKRCVCTGCVRGGTFGQEEQTRSQTARAMEHHVCSNLPLTHQTNLLVTLLILPSAISVTWGQAAFVRPIRADHLYWCWAPKISACLSTQLLLLKWLFMQVTLKQHRFEVCGPTHLLKFFSLDICFVFHPGLGVWGCTESTVYSDLWPFYIGDRTSPVLV